MGRSELDAYAKKVRDIKNLINVEWGNQTHPDAIDDQVGITAFDQVMDQVLNVIECYQEVVSTDVQVPEKVIQKAADAHLEALKAGCRFLEKIASNLVDTCKQNIQRLRPATDQILRLNEQVNKFKREIEDARHLWEEDDPAGLERLRNVIGEIDNVADTLSLAVPAVVHTEARATREESRSKWRLIAEWVGIGVAILLAFLSFVRTLWRGQPGE